MLIGDRGCTGAGGDGSEPLVRRREGSGSFLALFCVTFSVRRQVMTAHKFAIGQMVRFDAKDTSIAETSGSL